jgi:hypothetical protein
MSLYNTVGGKTETPPLKEVKLTRCWWSTPIILATWEAEIRKVIQGQPGEIACESPISKITKAKWTEMWLKQ